MTYENAPGTKLLATQCACCGRALLDAVSVETGMGPHCRKAHGYADAQGEANWALVMAELDSVLAVAEVNPEMGQRKAANVVVHRIACLGEALPQLLAMVNALRALGFTKLAARITQRWASIRIEETPEGLSVKTPFNEDFVPAARAIPGRRWVKPVNIFPASSKPQLWAALRKCFAGRIASGPKGLFVITA